MRRTALLIQFRGDQVKRAVIIFESTSPKMNSRRFSTTFHGAVCMPRRPKEIRKVKWNLTEPFVMFLQLVLKPVYLIVAVEGFQCLSAPGSVIGQTQLPLVASIKKKNLTFISKIRGYTWRY